MAVAARPQKNGNFAPNSHRKKFGKFGGHGPEPGAGTVCTRAKRTQFARHRAVGAGRRREHGVQRVLRLPVTASGLPCLPIVVEAPTSVGFR